MIRCKEWIVEEERWLFLENEGSGAWDSGLLILLWKMKKLQVGSKSRCQSLFCEKEHAPLATSPMKGWAPRHSSHLWKCCPHNPSLPQNQALITVRVFWTVKESSQWPLLSYRKRETLCCLENKKARQSFISAR